MKKLFFASAIALAGASSAGAEKPKRFQVAWVVAPDDTVKGHRAVPPKGLILRQRLLPVGIARLDGAFVGAKPSDQLPEGTELLLASGAEKPVYCSQNFIPVLSLGVGIHKGSTRCFVDDNEDGAFDRAFYAPSDIVELPSAAGEIPTKGSTPCNVRYSKPSADTLTTPYYLGVQYIGQAKLGSLRRFMTVYGTEKRWGYLTGDNLFTKRDADLPKSLNIYGSTIVIKGGEGKSVLVDVEQGMPAQPFAVGYSVMYY